MPNADFDLVIIRHGQSEANKENIFTGWRDSPLSPAGVEEARAGGKLMRDAGLRFDLAFTSLQSRAIKTLWLALEEVAKFGEQQVHLWRRGYDTRPPEVETASPEYPKHDPRYHGVPEAQMPCGESLKDVVDRVMPYWHADIAPQIKAGKKVLIAAHGNSLRALLKHLEGVSDKAIEDINLPTGIPKIYKLNTRLLSERTDFLGDPAEVAARAHAVANQTKKK